MAELSRGGIVIAEKISRDDIVLHKERQAIFNYQIDPSSLVQLLWKEEALNILKENKLEKGLISKPRKLLWNKLVEELPLHVLKSYVIEALRSRQDWRD